MHPKPTKYHSRKYLDHLHTQECEAKDLGGCMGDVVGAHLDGAGGKGIGTKTDDFFSGPLCYAHHQEEGRGWARFYHRLVAESTYRLLQYIKAYRFLKHLRWLVSKGETSGIIELIREYK